MAGVAATIDLRITAKQTGSADLGTPQMQAVLEKVLEFVPGTAAVGQTNILFSDRRQLAASANEDLDLAGVLADALGATIASAELVAIAVVAAEGNTNNVNVIRPASNGVPLFLAAGDGVAVKPGNVFLLTDKNGIAVTAGTGDLINIANSGAGSVVNYDIIILGRTVAA